MLNDRFGGRVVFPGFGAVAQCAPPTTMEIAGPRTDRYRVIDMSDRAGRLDGSIAAGPIFVEDGIARDLKIRVIHISERDAQAVNKPEEVGEFVDT